MLQLWESILTLRTPDDKEIAEEWSRNISAVIRNRVDKVCRLELHTCIYLYVQISCYASL